MKKYTLYWYYKTQICRLQKKIESVRLSYAQRSSLSSKNFEFDHLVEEDTKKIKKDIYRIKRKMCSIR